MIDSNFWYNLAKNVRDEKLQDRMMATDRTDKLLDGLTNAFNGAYERKREDNEKREGFEKLNKQREAAANWLKSQDIDGFTYTDEVEQAIMNSDDPMGLAKEIYAERQGRVDKKEDGDKATLENMARFYAERVNTYSVGTTHSAAEEMQYDKDVSTLDKILNVYGMKYGSSELKALMGELNPKIDDAEVIQSTPIIEGGEDEVAKPSHSKPKEVNSLTGKPVDNGFDFTSSEGLKKSGSYTFEDIEAIAKNTEPSVLESFIADLEASANNNAISLLKDEKVNAMLQSKMKSLPGETYNSLLQKFPRMMSLLGEFETDFGIKEKARRDSLTKKRKQTSEDQGFVDEQKDRKKKQEEEAKTTDETTKLNVAKSKLQELLRSTQKISRFKAPDGIDVDAWKKICNENSDEIILHNKYLK